MIDDITQMKAMIAQMQATLDAMQPKPTPEQAALQQLIARLTPLQKQLAQHFNLSVEDYARNTEQYRDFLATGELDLSSMPGQDEGE